MPQWAFPFRAATSEGFSAFDPCEETATMANGPRWNNPNTANPAVNAAMKRRMHNARMREMRLRQEDAARRALAKLMRHATQGCHGQFVPSAQSWTSSFEGHHLTSENENSKEVGRSRGVTLRGAYIKVENSSIQPQYRRTTLARAAQTPHQSRESSDSPLQ
jgi:hypothetical protein